DAVVGKRAPTVQRVVREVDEVLDAAGGSVGPERLHEQPVVQADRFVASRKTCQSQRDVGDARLDRGQHVGLVLGGLRELHQQVIALQAGCEVALVKGQAVGVGRAMQHVLVKLRDELDVVQVVG